jgi:hypothetical protein
MPCVTYGVTLSTYLLMAFGIMVYSAVSMLSVAGVVFGVLSEKLRVAVVSLAVLLIAGSGMGSVVLV